MLHIPLTWGAVPGQGHLTAICNYTATWLFPHSVPIVDVKRSMEVAQKTKSGFSTASSDSFITEMSLFTKVGMCLQTFTKRLNILREICVQKLQLYNRMLI